MRRVLFVFFLLVLLLLPATPVSADEQPRNATVLRNSNLRAGPGMNYPVSGSQVAGSRVIILRTVQGQAIVQGNTTWYDLGQNRYIYYDLVSIESTPVQSEPQPATTTDANPNGLKLTWHVIGQSSTSFRNSDWGRLVNIRVSTLKLNGMLIPPGMRFSINGALGKVDTTAGYKMSQGLMNGRVVPAMGGGICQTATTIFRAAFFGGLPINERTNHALRLHWYEDKPGLDAAVDDGWPDLVFTNDTGGPIQIRATIDERTATQTIQLVGTIPAKRTVQTEGPVGTWNSVTVHRIVTYEGGQMAKQTFHSYYMR